MSEHQTCGSCGAVQSDCLAVEDVDGSVIAYMCLACWDDFGSDG